VDQLALLLKGRRVQAVPTVIEQREVVIDTLEEFIPTSYRKARRRSMLDDVTEVNVGSLAPDFRLESNGGALVRLSEYRGRAHMVLYFMREFT